MFCLACGVVDDVLTEGVLNVRLSDVVVLFDTIELWADCDTRTVAFCGCCCCVALAALLLFASNLELIIGGCDFTGILCTVNLVGPAIERVDLMGDMPIARPSALSSRSGTICGPLCGWLLW